MFFSELIKSIDPDDSVLEVGPGSDPHTRSNVLLEIDVDASELLRQRGNTPELKTDKKIVYYDGKKFPFKDNEFDYVICSHVLEHVENPSSFYSELTRVARKGYIEFPTIYYEYLYNFDVHLNFVRFDKEKNIIFYKKKRNTPISHFKGVNNTFIKALEMGYSDIVDDLKHIMFQGFEWERSNMPRVVEADELKLLLLDNNVISRKLRQPVSIPNESAGSVNHDTKKTTLVRKIVRRIISAVR